MQRSRMRIRPRLLALILLTVLPMVVLLPARAIAQSAYAQQANRIVQHIASAFTIAGFIAVGVGILVVLVGMVVIVRSHRRNSMPPSRPAGEGRSSWL